MCLEKTKYTMQCKIINLIVKHVSLYAHTNMTYQLTRLHTISCASVPYTDYIWNIILKLEFYLVLAICYTLKTVIYKYCLSKSKQLTILKLPLHWYLSIQIISHLFFCRLPSSGRVLLFFVKKLLIGSRHSIKILLRRVAVMIIVKHS